VATLRRGPIVTRYNAPARQQADQPPNLLAGTLAAPQPVPFAQSDWPLPGRPVFPAENRSWAYSALYLRGQDAFFAGPGVGPDYDYPNPRVRPFPIEGRSFDYSILPNLLGQDSFPARNTDFPNPGRAGQRILPIDANTAPLNVVVGPAPFVPPDFPNPRIQQSWMRMPDGNLLATTLADVPVVVTPPPPVISVGGTGPKKRKWYQVGNKFYKATEQELRQILEALVIEEAEPESEPELPDVPEREAEDEAPVRSFGLLATKPAIPQLPDFSALMARQSDAMVLALMREIALRYLEDQDDEDMLLLH
jgi:hypothetical protein